MTLRVANPESTERNPFDTYARLSVPRYTSYPTTPHFTEPFSPGLVGRWIQTLHEDEAVSLYIHIPFCEKLCWYCGCNMKLVARYEPIAAYVKELISEIRLYAELLHFKPKVRHLHFGGGTPTSLNPSDLSRLMTLLGQVFDLSDMDECAIECDPRTLTDDMAQTIGGLGFNRVSLGIQSFDKDVQTLINRIQPLEMVQDTFEMLRKAGVSAINFDLLYGLPGQSLESLYDTVEKSVAIRPNRFALFGYAHVPWMSKKQRLIDETQLPDAQARKEQALAAAAFLKASGYHRIGLDHFALPEDSMAVADQQGTLKRNFQGYTTDTARTLLAFGSSAIGKTPYGYYQNHTAVKQWSSAVERGALPIKKGHMFKPTDYMDAEIIEALMCAGSVNLKESANRHAVRYTLSDQQKEQLKAMEADGLIVWTRDQIDITQNAKPLCRVIASVFDRYLQNGKKARHSVAV